MFIRKSPEVSSCHVRLILEVGTLSIKCSKTLYFFERAPRRFLLFDLKDDEENSGGAVLIKCVFASCVMPESVLFVSSSVCACVSLGGVYLFVEGRGFHVEGRGYHDEGNFFSIF